jgi:hypothetical protein
MKRRAAFLAGCVFSFILSCDDGALLRDYVNDHVVAAAFGGLAVADAEEWEGAGGGVSRIPELVDKLRFLSRERGQVVVTPKSERERLGQPENTVLKITLNNERGTVYEPSLSGADAGLAQVTPAEGAFVFYITLGAVEREGPLDIVLHLKPPPAHKPPDPITLPIVCAFSDGPVGAYQIVVVPGTANVSQGNSQQFYATSSATGAVSGVRWNVTGGESGTGISSTTGLLTVGATEPVGKQPLTVRAEAPGYLSGTATVTVVDYVVTIDPPEVTIPRGLTAEFNATATIGGVPITGTWDWSIIGSSRASDIVTQGNDGVLTVGTDEEMMTLTVVATLREDRQIQGTAVVKIPTVTGVTITPSAARVIRGGTQSFRAEVKGVALAPENEGVTWSVEDSNGNPVSSNILGSYLIVELDETADMLTVRATSSFDDTKSGTATVQIPTVNGVTVSGATSFVRGGSVQFTVVVNGSALANTDKEVTWSWSGNTNRRTMIDQTSFDSATGISTGYLTVPTEETAGTLTVTATSVYDTAKSGTVTVSVEMVASVTQNGVPSYYATLQEAVAFATGGTVGDPAVITLIKNVTLDSPITLSDKHIKLVPADGATRMITRGNTPDSLFTLSDGANLTLEGGTDAHELIIDGGKELGKTGSQPLITVEVGTLTMNSNVALQNNNMTDSGASGGGVYLKGDPDLSSWCANFFMNGGIIRDNIGAVYGGGVCLKDNAYFKKTGGDIVNNASNIGGGVDVGSLSNIGNANNQFEFFAGGICDNTAANEGGGIAVYSGTVSMQNAYMEVNHANSHGGGVAIVGSEGIFTMETSEIKGNYANGSGGGVYISGGGAFTMEPSGNVLGTNSYNENKADFDNDGTGDGHAVYCQSGFVNGREYTNGVWDDSFY